jgi:hypothetical protein
MKVAVRSNCLFGAVAIKRQLGGKLEWRAAWKPTGGRNPGGWPGFINNPWGHFRVRLGDTLWSYSPLGNKSLSVWRQLWFQGYAKCREVTNESW